jgi:phosphate transport system protein
MNTTEHTLKQYDADLSALRSRIVEMGSLVEDQFRMSIEALTQGSSQLADTVIANDARVNELESEIDDDCAHLIARRQPAAGDLRMVLGISKMVTDLERIGDKARKIARLSGAIRMSSMADAAWLDQTQRAGDDARALLRQAIAAFVRGEVDMAVDVLRSVQKIAKQTAATTGDIVRKIAANPGEVAVLLDMLAVTKAVDRVADHAANVAEYLIYIVQGTDVRHATLDQIEREALQR